MNLYRILLFLLLFGCNSNETKKEYIDNKLYSETQYNKKGEKEGLQIVYYPSGNERYKTFYSKDNIDSIIEYYDTIRLIHSKFINKGNGIYFTTINAKDGKSFTKGNNKLLDLNKNKFIREGWWYQYVNKKEVSKIEYITVGDTTKVNQIYSFDINGDIKLDESHYYKINLPDTVTFNKPYKFTIELISPILGIQNIYATALKLSDDIPSDYLNFWKSKSNYQTKELKTNLWEINHTFTQKGDFTMRGFIWRTWLEFEDRGNQDSITALEYKDITYLKKEIYVK